MLKRTPFYREILVGDDNTIGSSGTPGLTIQVCCIKILACVHLSQKIVYNLYKNLTCNYCAWISNVNTYEWKPRSRAQLTRRGDPGELSHVLHFVPFCRDER